MQNLTQVPQSRPLGVTVIAVLTAVQGILYLLIGITALFALTLRQSNLILLAFLPIILGVLSLVLAWGLWNLKRWAFWATVVLEAISIIDSLTSLSQPNQSLSTTILSILLSAIILIYFLADAHVRAAFHA